MLVLIALSVVTGGAFVLRLRTLFRAAANDARTFPLFRWLSALVLGTVNNF